MTFRKATIEDGKRLKCLAREVIQQSYSPFLGAEMVAAYIDSGEADKEIDEGIENCTLLLEASDLIGFSITKQDILHLMMLAPPFQKQGKGRFLLRHTEDELFLKYDKIRLQSFKENAAANCFYLKNGWTLTAAQPDENAEIAMLHFEKRK